MTLSVDVRLDGRVIAEEELMVVIRTSVAVRVECAPSALGWLDRTFMVLTYDVHAGGAP